MQNESHPFKFKQFSVYQDRCAFKVGTDSVILGSWLQNINGNVLDVGTGTGVLSLMLAQKSNSNITAIDIDEEQVNQANQNFVQSPWSNRLKAFCKDFNDFDSNQKFDHIVSNPPYFEKGIKNTDQRLSNARHQNTLNVEQLIKKSAELLNFKGKLSVIIPHDIACRFLSEGLGNSLYLTQRLSIYSKNEGNSVRECLTFEKNTLPQKATFTQLFIYDGGKLSEEFKTLTKDYYLDF
jgi:tRNA1Val (adenine37-N6)-methyltransferase